MTLSKWTRVQGGNGPAVVIYLCGDIDIALRAALPGVPIVRTASSGNGAGLGDLDAALRVAGSNTLGALCGFSAGCGGVWGHLHAGVDPVAVVCADGTAGPWPLPNGHPKVEVWRARAAQPKRVTVLTATQQRYTERLVRTATQPQGPFAATSTVLRRALDWAAIDELRPLSPAQGNAFKYPGEPVAEWHRDGAHAFLYPGTDCDAAAHSAQLVHVLPEMLRRYVGPALGLQVDGGGLRALLAPLEALGRAVAVRLGEAWEAAAGATIGALSHGARAAVAELYQDAVATGTWHPASEGIDPAPGDLLISARAGGDPTKGGTGHVEMAIAWSGAVLNTLGGNEQDRWILAPFNLRDLSYRGFIRRDPELGRRCILIAMAEYDAGVREVPGPASNPRVSAYLGCCRRGGSPLAGMPGHELEGGSTLGDAPPDSFAWCAAAQSWVTIQALAS